MTDSIDDAYNMIDRFLRNNLYDDDYAEFSAALDTLASQEADINTVLQRAIWDSAEIVHCPTRPAHTEQDVREILQTVQYKLGADRLEIVVRRILGVPK